MIDFSSFLEANQGSGLITDSTGKIQDCNPSSAEIFGFSNEDFIGMQILDLLPGLHGMFDLDGDHRVDEQILPYKSSKGKDCQLRIRSNLFKEESNLFLWFSFENIARSGTPENDASFYKKLVNKSRNLIAYFDPEFKCTFISPSVKSFLGFNEEEIYQLDWKAIIHPDDISDFFNLLEHEVKNRIINSSHQLRLKHKNGNDIWISAESEREFDTDGKYLGAVLSIVHFEQQIKIEDKLKKESEKFQLLTENISDVITWLSSEGEVLYQSPTLYELLGYSPDSIKHINEANKLIHPDDLRAFKVIRQKNARRKADKYTIRVRIKNASEEYLWLETNIRNTYNDSGELEHIIFTSRDITDRKNSELKLAESELNYRYLAENSNDVIVRLDAQNQIIYISPSAESVLGYSAEDLKTKQFFTDFIYSSDINKYETGWRRSLRKKENFQFNRLRLIQKSGKPLWVEILVKREYDKESNHIHSIANIRDISDRMGDQIELERISERFQLAAEAGHTGVWDYTFFNSRLIIDNSLKNLLGYSTDNTIDEDLFWEKLVHAEDKKYLRETINKNIDSGKSYFEATHRMWHKSRIALWVLCRGKIFYKKGKPDRIVCSVTDITERKESNEQLQKVIVNFNAIFDAFPDLFFRVNSLGYFLEIMAGESADYGSSNLQNFEGKNIKSALPEKAYYKLYKSLQNSLVSGKVEVCEYDLDVEGETRYYEARIIGISNDEAIGIVRNITEAVETNIELVEARKTAEEALNAKEEFLSMMSHEIRTPLNVVIGMTYLLLKQEPRPDQLKLINSLKFSSDNLLSIINDILDFSKIKAGKLVFEKTRVNLRKLLWSIHDSYKLQLDNTRIEFDLEIDDTLPEIVESDPNRLAQVLNNLLSNAVKFTERGYIKIELMVVGSNEDTVNIELNIKDSGIGIPEEKVLTIFEPFNQAGDDTARKYGGTGLGLTIVRQLIELMDGTIAVESSTGKGSSFTIQLPFRIIENVDTINHVEELEESLEDKISNINLLYADDVESNQFLMKGYADLWDIDIALASNGEEALDKFTNQHFDILLLDLQMPLMNGFDVALEIRKIEENIDTYTPIIAVTGDLSESSIQRMTEAGMDGYISKPVNPKLLLEKIHDLVYFKGRLSEVNPEAEPVETGEETIEVNEKKFIDFTDVDYLYGEVPDQYMQLLKLISDEYKAYNVQLEIVLKEENFDEFRNIRHTMKSNMKLFKLHKMEALLDEIKVRFVKNELPPAGGNYVYKIKKCIDDLHIAFSEKQKTIIELR